MVTSENGEQTPLSEAISAEKKSTETAEKKPVQPSKACVTTPQTANEPERKIRFDRFIFSFFPKLYDKIKKTSWIPAGVITFDDMGFVQLETGINTYVAYSCTGETAALIPMSEKVMEHLATLDNINPADNQPYKADLMEMCVAKFNGKTKYFFCY